MGPFPVSSRAGERNAPQDRPATWPCLATAALPPLAAARVVPRSSSRPAVRFPGRRPAPRTIAPRAKRHPGPDPTPPHAAPRRPAPPRAAPRRPSAAEPPPPPPPPPPASPHASGLPGPSVRTTCVEEGSRKRTFSNLAEVGEGPLPPRVGASSSSSSSLEASCEGRAFCLFVSLPFPKFRPPKLKNAIQTWPRRTPQRRRSGHHEPRPSFPPGAAASLAAKTCRVGAAAGCDVRIGTKEEENSFLKKIPFTTPNPSWLPPCVATAGLGPPPPVSVVATRGAATRGGDRGGPGGGRRSHSGVARVAPGGIRGHPESDLSRQPQPAAPSAKPLLSIYDKLFENLLYIIVHNVVWYLHRTSAKDSPKRIMPSNKRRSRPKVQ